MLLAEYMRKKHPPPTDYIEPEVKTRKLVEIKYVKIPVVHLDMARAFVMVAITGAILLPGKWGILAGVVGNAYWLYKIK